MPRVMPDLAGRLRREVDRALALAAAGEAIRTQTQGNLKLRRELTLFRLQLMYEMAFLHVFVNWEAFLEDSFLRYMCGYANSSGQQVTLSAAYERTMARARSKLFASKQYLLWHSPKSIQERSRRFFAGGLHETVIASNMARMEWFRIG